MPVDKLVLREAHRNFSRMFDLAERVLPEEHYCGKMEPPEASALLRLAARARGIGTASDLADYYRMPIRAASRSPRKVHMTGIKSTD